MACLSWNLSTSVVSSALHLCDLLDDSNLTVSDAESQALSVALRTAAALRYDHSVLASRRGRG